ncbi:major facilitator superfamily domain-containing protein 6 [Colwellia sp. KU-HH00111]|uniref:MFS transporter n=1 Tax=Colwellia sp. KU-HH00111 TaxID=3127652 RepID=UPI0031096C92
MSLFTRLATSYFFYFAILGLISPYLSVFLDGKGFTSVELGEIFAILTATKIVAPSLWAILADKTGQKLLIIRLGALLALLSFIVLFWLNSYWPISFCLALFSLFWTAILPQLEVFTLTSVRHSSKIYARIRLWGSLGFIVLAVVAGQVMEYYAPGNLLNSEANLFTNAFVWMGTVILLCLLISTMVIKPQRIVNKPQQQALAITGKLLDLRFIIFFMAGVLLQISFGPYYGFFALFLRDLAYPGVAVGLLISLGVVAEILIFIFASSFFKAFTLKAILIVSLAATALRWFIVALYAESIWLLALTQLIHAASFALFHSASMIFISEHFTRCQQSRGQAVYLGGVYGVGGAIGAYIAGVLWLDGLGASTTFLTASVSAFIAALLMLFWPKTIKKPSQ